MVTFLFFFGPKYSMVQPLTKQEFSLYALLYLKFQDKAFDFGSVKWYYSRQMLKKLIFGLNEAGWIRHIERGSYACIAPKEAVARMFKPRVEEVLKEAGLKFGFTKASAAEIWSDEVYIQRSWEYRPFFIKVLKKDLKKWEQSLTSQEISFFTGDPANVVGEFVILVPVTDLKITYHNGKPVVSLSETIAFCESNKDSFEYVLAYLTNKYKRKTTASKEMLVKAREAL